MTQDTMIDQIKKNVEEMGKNKMHEIDQLTMMVDTQRMLIRILQLHIKEQDDIPSPNRDIRYLCDYCGCSLIGKEFMYQVKLKDRYVCLCNDCMWYYLEDLK